MLIRAGTCGPGAKSFAALLGLEQRRRQRLCMSRSYPENVNICSIFAFLTSKGEFDIEMNDIQIDECEVFILLSRSCSVKKIENAMAS